MVAETHILNINAAFLSAPILHTDRGATSILDEILVSADITSETEPLVAAPRAPRLDDDEDLDEDEDEDDGDDYEDGELEDDEEEDGDDEGDDFEEDDEDEDDEDEDEDDDDDEDDGEEDDVLRVRKGR